jgi:hypothetical protein
MELKGRVFLVGNVEVVSEKFQKRELILEYSENPEYVEYIKFEASQKKVDILDGIKVGDTVEAHFNLKGRGWKDKSGKQNYTNTLALWRIVKVDGEQAMSSANVGFNDESGDLPF